MKKIIVLISVFSLLSFGLVLPVLAEETVNPALVVDDNSQAVFKPRQVVIYGDLTAISQPAVPSDLTIKVTRVIPPKIAKLADIYPQKDGLAKVLVIDKTKIVRKFMGRADLSELAVGDKLMVTGKLQADGSVVAQLVKDDSIHKTFYARKGEVMAIDTATNTFNIKNEKKEFKIFVTPNTKFAKWGVKLPTLADLKVGDKVAVRGVIRQVANEITADSVVIQVSQEEIAAKKLEEKKAVTLKLLEKKTVNLIKQLKNKKAVLEKQILKMKGKALEKKRQELEGVNKQLEEIGSTTSLISTSTIQ